MEPLLRLYATFLVALSLPPTLWAAPSRTAMADEWYSPSNAAPEFRLVNKKLPMSRHLKPTPRIEVPANEDDESHFEKFPRFRMPADLWSINSHMSMTARQLLEVLDRGYTHVSAWDLYAEWGDNNPKVGREVPYNRRFEMIYNNEMDSLNTPSRRWREGYLPADEAEKEQIKQSFMTFAGDGGWFEDGKASQICALDIESGPAQGVDRDAWEDIKRSCFFEPIQAEYGKRFPSNMVLLSTCADEHSSWAKLQNAGERLAYLKFNFWSGSQNSHSWTWDHNNHGQRFMEICDRYGSWVDFMIRNTEANIKKSADFGKDRASMPALNMFTTGYDDLLCFGVTPPPGHDRYYYLRLDIAEGLPIWSYMSGAKGFILWQATRVSPHWEVEEALIKGCWRIAQHPDVFNGKQRYLIPEVSVDGGHSWQKQDNGFEHGSWGNGLSGPYPLNDYFNGNKDWKDVQPSLASRVRARAVVNGTRILVAAIDAWQTNSLNRQQIRVRLPELKFEDGITLHGRETYLGRATLKR